MSVTSVTNSVSHIYNGGTRVFPYTFRIVSDDDLLVTIDASGADAAQTLTRGTGYSVSGVNFYEGGTITIANTVSIPESGVIRIARKINLYTQDTVFRNQGAFYASTVEDALDKLTMMSQELKTKIELSPTYPVTDVLVDLTFPAPVLTGYFKWARRTVGNPAAYQYYIASSTITVDELPTITIAKGGTGAVTAAAAWTNIGTPNAATASPLVDGGSASVGTATKFAREDHVHPRSTLADLGAAGRGANTDLTSVALTSGTVSTAPATSTSIVNKAYVDTVIPAGTKFRSVEYVSTTNLGTSYAGTTISGTGSLIVGSLFPQNNARILVRNQTSAVQNGIYVVTQASSPWTLTRTADWALNSIVSSEDYVHSAWLTDAQGASAWAPLEFGVTVGVQAVNFTQVAGSPATNAPYIDAATAAVGTSRKFAREDHQHARPTLVDLNAAARGANTDITSIALTSGTVSTAPASSTDIVNKAYADGIAQGINFHQAVVLATAANITAFTATNTLTGITPNDALVVDGVTVSLNQRVLVKNQTLGARNGIYTLTTAPAVNVTWQLTRATDYDSAGSGPDQVTTGDFILVLGGNTQTNSAWVLQTAAPITIGTTALTFVQFAGAGNGSVTSITAGTGLSGGTITSSGTIALASVIVAQSSIGSATQIPVLSVNAQGQVTALSSVTASGGGGGATLAATEPAALAAAAVIGLSTFAARADHQHVFPTAAQTGALGAAAAAGGDLAGSYPNPTLAAITAAQSSVGSSTVIPILSIDAKGRVTALSSVSASAASAFTVAPIQASSLTIDPSFAQKIVPFSVATGVLVTLPADANAAISPGTEIKVVMTSVQGEVAFSPGSGATIYAPSNYRAITTPYATATATKLFANTWVLSGFLAQETGAFVDANFSNVSLLLHMNGADLGSSFVDSSTNNYAVTSVNAVTSTTQVKFGTASYLGASGRYLTVHTNNTPFAFGTADFTIEFWIRPTSFSAQQNLIVFSNLTAAAIIVTANTGICIYQLNNANLITSTGLALNFWNYIAISRVSGVTRMFLNGIVQTQTYTDGTNYLSTGALWQIGGGAAPVLGNLDDLRVTKGVGRYFQNFTAPISQFPDA